MKRKELINLYLSLKQMGKLTGVKFSYAVAKNLKALEGEMEATQKTLDQSEQYKVYEDARIKLAASHAEKDASGKPKTENNNYVIADMPKFEEELNALKEQHKPAIESREKQIAAHEAFLEEEVNFKLHKVKLSDIPEQVNTQQMFQLFAMIEEEKTK